jgi:hypothetical protein
VLLASGIRYLLRTFAWRLTFLPTEQISLGRLFRGMIAGEAMSYLTVTGPLLGEPLKAAMVGNVAFGKSLTSTVAEAFLNALAASLLTVAGLLLLSLQAMRGTHPLVYETVAIMVCVALVAAAFWVLKHTSSVFTFAVRALRWGLGSKSQRWGEACSVIEARLAHLRQERPGALEGILTITLVCQVLLILEIVLVLWPLKYHLDWTTLLIVEAGTKLAKALFFFVPARIGADEGSSAGIFALLGMSSYPGVALVLVRRLRAFAWTLLGLGFLAATANAPDRAEAPPPAGAER